MSNVENNTDDLIGKLCNELEPIKPFCPYRRIIPWFLMSIVYLVGAVVYLGLRHDISDRLMDSIYLFEMGVALAIFITAALTSSWLSFPDAHQKGWMKAVPITLFGIFIFWIAVRSFEEGMSPLATLHLTHCAHEGLVMETIPIIALIFITMRGHTTQPYWSMFMNILAVSTIGWIGLRLTCSMDQMGHTLLNHLLPFAIVSAGLAFFARKLFKW